MTEIAVRFGNGREELFPGPAGWWSRVERWAYRRPVTPPAKADRDPLPKSSLWVRPGSRKWTWIHQARENAEGSLFQVIAAIRSPHVRFDRSRVQKHAAASDCQLRGLHSEPLPWVVGQFQSATTSPASISCQRHPPPAGVSVPHEIDS